MALCNICGTKLSGECLKLGSNISLDSDKTYDEKIAEILGEEFIFCSESSDKMCKKCALHLKQIDKLEKDLKLCKNKFLLRIHKNYELSIAGHHDVKSLNTGEKLEELDITDKGTIVTAKDDSVDSSIKMLKVEKKKKPCKNSHMQSRLLTKNNKESNEDLANKPSFVKQVSKIQLQSDKLDCDAFNKGTSITANDNLVDSPMQILRDKNENKPVSSVKIMFSCDFCDYCSKNPELMCSHVRSHEIKSNDERSNETKPLSLMQVGNKQWQTSGEIKVPKFEDTDLLSDGYTCGLCMRNFPDLDYLRSHMNLHNSKENDENKALPKLFNPMQAINKQSQTGEELKKPVSPTKIYLCDLCNTYYENLELLCYHVCSRTNTKNDKALGNPSSLAQEPSVYKCSVCLLNFDSEKNCLIHIAENHLVQLSSIIAENKEKNAKTEDKNKGTVDTNLHKFLENPHVEDLLNEQKEFHYTKEESTAKKKCTPDQEQKKPVLLVALHTQQTDEEISDRRKELKKKLAMRRRQITARS